MRITTRERSLSAKDSVSSAVNVDEHDFMRYKSHWLVEKWTPDQIEFARKELLNKGIKEVPNGTRIVDLSDRSRAKIASKIMGRPVADLRVVQLTANLEMGDAVPSYLLRAILGDNPEDGIAEQDGNLLLNIGIQKVEELLAGISTPTKWDSTNARIGVGDSTTAESASQTDLQAATNHTFVGMNATYPSRASQTLSWQADHTSSNFAWQEVCVDNGSSAHQLLNRKVTSLGTKTTGTWTITLTIALS